VHGGLVLEDVEADAGDGVGGEGGDEGGFVDDGAAGCVDEGGGGFHERELRGGEEVVGRVLRGGGRGGVLVSLRVFWGGWWLEEGSGCWGGKETYI